MKNQVFEKRKRQMNVTRSNKYQRNDLRNIYGIQSRVKNVTDKQNKNNNGTEERVKRHSVKKMFSNVLDFRYNYLLTPAEIVLSVF
jgi:hypothetical protein